MSRERELLKEALVFISQVSTTYNTTLELKIKEELAKPEKYVSIDALCKQMHEYEAAYEGGAIAKIWFKRGVRACLNNGITKCGE